MKVKLGWVMAITLLAGCISPPWGDWNKRIGNYNYDQAVKDMGVPKAVAKQPDGRLLAAWLIQRGQSGSVGFGMGGEFASPGFLESQVPFESSPTPNRYLILTFGPDNRLVGWQRKYG